MFKLFLRMINHCHEWCQFFLTLAILYWALSWKHIRIVLLLFFFFWALCQTIEAQKYGFLYFIFYFCNKCSPLHLWPQKMEKTCSENRKTRQTNVRSPSCHSIIFITCFQWKSTGDNFWQLKLLLQCSNHNKLSL